MDSPSWEPNEPLLLLGNDLVSGAAVGAADFHELGGPLMLPRALDPFLCDEAKRVESGVLATLPEVSVA